MEEQTQKIEIPASNGSRPVSSPDKIRKSPPPIALGVGAIVLCIALYFGIRWFQYNSVHVSTDDAQVGGDIYAVSAQVTGYVLSVPITSNQFVRQGDVLATIDPRTYQDALNQALATLSSLRAAAAASGHQVSVTRQQSGANENQASAGVRAADANTAAATTKLEGLRSGVSAARAALDATRAGADAAHHAISSAEAQVRSMETQHASAEAARTAATANERKAANDARRFGSLFSQGAISAQQNDAVQTTLQSADAQVQEARQAVADSTARISQAESQVESARASAQQADAAVQQAVVGVKVAQDQVASGEAAVTQAQAQAGQSAATLQSAESAPAQVSVTSSNAASNSAKIAQAEAAVNQARIQLSYCRIVAPTDGYVSEKNIEPGQLVQPGQALMAVVPLNGTYVDANYKETQLEDIRIGQPAEIEADTFGGKIFNGHVLSIASATGATFSLLPPENATGNFVKVVQRIPVRISLDQNADPNHLLRLGMSVTATVDLRK